MEKRDLLSYLLHHMKGVEPYSKTFSWLLWGHKKWCPFTHGEEIGYDCYKAVPAIKGLLKSLEEYISCCRFLDVDRRDVDDMTNILEKLKNPETVVYIDVFESLTKELREHIVSLEDEISEKLRRMSCLECMRLDEAMVCFKNFCFHASTVMAVSGVESRIHEMIRRTDEKLYSSHFEKSTLGQLVQVFDEDHFKDKKFKSIKELVPKMHKPLLALLNEYRVFSAHPKEESMPAQIAESVLHLSFAFLMDPATNPYDKDELICK